MRKTLLKWTGIVFLDILIALMLLGTYLELKGNYTSILLQKPVDTKWFGIVPEHPISAPMWVTRIRGPFPLPHGLADYGIISVSDGNVILKGEPNHAAYQSLSFYPNSYPRLGSAAPSVLDFENLELDDDGTYVIHISNQKQAGMKNWLDSQSAPGGMIALRSYRPFPGSTIEYPSVQVAGKLIQDKKLIILGETNL